ncbi:glucans biosynthesis glucosyltransferase MdoH [Rhodospirillaceae bacterium SYSU D60014]|uniref:glucans biosynthesis glucosyltransferase MdoH n=1 Tax=Virgifigura deserti TaxID=2268457 RepID=UPI000E65EE8F
MVPTSSNGSEGGWQGSAASAWTRRLLVFGATGLSIVAATRAMHAVLSSGGLTELDVVLLALFTISFAWIAISFWSVTAGFFALMAGRQTAGLVMPAGVIPGTEAAEEKGPPLATRTAILMPVYNEDPARVTAHLQAMYESLAETGHLDSFDFFILSDSTDPAVWVAEEMNWLSFCRRVGGQGRIFYRKRRRNTARKAGNIADFCCRWGCRYDHMVVLDADSIMAGETLVAMARLMEANPRAGIIQAPPVTVNRNTLFARFQQFANRLYGPVSTAGFAFWSLGDGNYWGHNAIIRTRAFIESCGLPTLSGRPPFGGHILSHDFVEAALIRRAGWTVWLVPELGGSYEECPPTVIDYAKRDRRWCQGNLQHLRVLPAQRLRLLSRLHLVMGVMSYLASPLWLAMIVIGLLAAWQETLTEPTYFASYETLFPIWPLIDQGLAKSLFAIVIGMLLAPKLYSLVLLLRYRGAARRFGGFGRATLGVVLETVFSALLAPIMMLFHSGFVASILVGRDTGWGGQCRDDGGIGWGEALRRHGVHSLIGLALAVVSYWIEPALLPWMMPVVIGLVLAVPLTILSARQSLGRWTRRRGLFLIPEETETMPVLRRAAELADSIEGATVSSDGAVAAVVEDPLVNALHIALLPGDATPTAAEEAALASARLKLAQSEGDGPDPALLTVPEQMAVLFDPPTLRALQQDRLQDRAKAA